MNGAWVINCFEVQPERDEEFLELFGCVNAYMRTMPGFVSHRLHRAVRPEAHFRFVNVAEWRSLDHLTDARDPKFRELAAAVAAAGFGANPVFYELVSESHAPDEDEED